MLAPESTNADSHGDASRCYPPMDLLCTSTCKGTEKYMDGKSPKAGDRTCCPKGMHNVMPPTRDASYELTASVGGKSVTSYTPCQQVELTLTVKSIEKKVSRPFHVRGEG